MKIDRSNQWHQSVESAESVVVVGTARRGRIADETKDRGDGKNDSRGVRTDECSRLSRDDDDEEEEC